MKKLLILSIFFLALFLVFPSVGRCQDVPPYLYITDTSVTSADAVTSSVTTTVDLTTPLGLTASQLATQIALGNVYMRILVQSDGTVNGSANFLFSDSASTLATGLTTATTGVLVQEGQVVYVRVTGRYIHYAGIGTDPTHNFSAVRCELFFPN